MAKSLNYRREYNKQWRQNHRKRSNYLTYRNTARLFMRKWARPEDMHELHLIARERLSKHQNSLA